MPNLSSAITHVETVAVTGSGSDIRMDAVAVEEPLEICLAGNGIAPVPVSITMRTPGNDVELALGFLWSEGLLSSLDDLVQTAETDPANPDCPRSIQNQVTLTFRPGKYPDVDRLQRNFYTTSSCGVCGKGSIAALNALSPPAITPLARPVAADLLQSLPERLRRSQTVFKQTGGLHAAAAFSVSGELLLLREDVGRHNAVDKLVGAALLDNISLSQTILLLSGRTSFELIQKARMASIPVVASVGAPSSLAVKLARSSGIVLAGFVSSERLNIYSTPEHVFATDREIQTAA